MRWGSVLLTAAAFAGLGAFAFVWEERERYGRPVCYPQMWHLFEVGPGKPLGYLDWETIRENGYEVESLAQHFRESGMGTHLVQPSCDHFPHGALYVYDPTALQTLLDKYKDILRDAGWPKGAATFVAMVSDVSVNGRRNKALYRLIGVAFNDPRFV